MFAGRKVFLLFLVLCAAVLTVSVFRPAVSAEGAETPDTITAAIPEGYEKIAENSRFNLYLKQDTLALIVESKANGKLLYSTVQNPEEMKDNATWKGFYQSGIVMEYLEGVKSIPLQADFINTASKVDCRITGNGYEARVSYPEIGISYQIVLEMDEEGFSVSIPYESIREEQPDTYAVASFYVYPFMGYSYLGQDEGYMIIPDGQGALIELKDNEERFSSPFDRPVYGTNIGVETSVYSDWSVKAEQVLMPFCGMVHTEDRIGVLSFIEDGEASARIMAYPNGVRMKFDWVCAKYQYRMIYSQPTGPNSSTISMKTEHARPISIRQQFLLEDGENASYAGLACSLRRYMNERGYFGEAGSGRFDIAVDFLGAETENFVLGKQAVTMTTFRQAGEILEDLGSQGVKGISVNYRGWQEGGLSGALPTDGYQPAGCLGGDGELQNLVQDAAALNDRFSLEADFLHLNTQTHPLLFYSSFKTITSQTWSRPTFGKVYDTLYCLSPKKTVEIGENVINAFAEKGIPGVSLTGISSLMSDYYESDRYQDATAMMEQYEKLIRDAAEKAEVSLTQANCYLWRYAAALKNMPIAGSNYSYVKQDIPFIAITVSGKIPYYTEYVNFQANTHRFFLQLIEQGTRPSFLLTAEDPIKLQNTNSNDIYSSRYELYRELITSWWNELKALHDQLGDAEITNHVTEGDMVRVSWSNGTEVYLNFGTQTGSMDNVVLEKGEYKVVTRD